MAYTQEQLLAMAKPSQALVDAMRVKPFKSASGPDVTIEKMRQVRSDQLEEQRPLYPIPGPIPDEVKEVLHSVKARDGYDIPIKIYTPVKQSSSPSPLILLYHEGGWCQGDLNDEDHDARQFSRSLNAVCVNIDYRLAPEHAFPTGLNDCYDVTTWAAKTATPGHDLLPADPKAGFIVGGVSAGGNFAAVMCQTLRDENFSPPITGQYLSVASLMWHTEVPEKWQAECRSRTTSAEDPVLGNSLTGSEAFLHILQVDPKDPRFSPMLHKNLAGLPPAYFQLCGLDPLRDEGLLYARVLSEEHNTPVKVDMYEGLGHAGWFNWPELEQSKKFFADTVEGVRWLLQTRRS
ncbi:hypothetical protein AMS68_000388 [Peltaster fructicola]|uniref:Alpha/beta hydrolase fold-3 domain-containing protein n=1 Tax=Peltaster fructicola TaxID=286661 RepID=A0A6H0XJQ1_9PEZI|nr:hypothetical protein AMS68_000388 [Peltaster fructicola]